MKYHNLTIEQYVIPHVNIYAIPCAFHLNCYEIFINHVYENSPWSSFGILSQRVVCTSIPVVLPFPLHRLLLHCTPLPSISSHSVYANRAHRAFLVLDCNNYGGHPRSHGNLITRTHPECFISLSIFFAHWRMKSSITHRHILYIRIFHSVPLLSSLACLSSWPFHFVIRIYQSRRDEPPFSTFFRSDIYPRCADFPDSEIYILSTIRWRTYEFQINKGHPPIPVRFRSICFSIYFSSPLPILDQMSILPSVYSPLTYYHGRQRPFIGYLLLRYWNFFFRCRHLDIIQRISKSSRKAEVNISLILLSYFSMPFYFIIFFSFQKEKIMSSDNG